MDRNNEYKIYHNPSCRKSREALAFLKKETTDFKIIDYLKNPLNFDEIEEVIKNLVIKPIDLIRKNEEIWKITTEKKK